MSPCALCGRPSGDLHPVSKKKGNDRNGVRHRWDQVCLPCARELIAQAAEGRSRVRGYSTSGLRRLIEEYDR